jgi:pimeloyl-ACP methyl ester carboxylesterase
MTDKPNLVLVHGAFADGSSWSAVTQELQANGFHVTAPQFPQTSLAADVARLRQVLAWLDGPVIVAGHSYGGQVITALGTDTANVAGLVYIAAFGLDEGETIAALGAEAPQPRALANVIVDAQGFGRVPEDDFVDHFAADVDPVKARAMHAAQQPVAMSVFEDVMRTPAWKKLPSWYLVAANDEAIDPGEERMFAKRMGAETVEVASSHVPMVSQPHAVVELIEAAAKQAAATEAHTGATT